MLLFPWGCWFAAAALRAMTSCARAMWPWSRARKIHIVVYDEEAGSIVVTPSMAKGDERRRDV